jgi:[NiFe] hydrogenase diaphorase moiety small subunit
MSALKLRIDGKEISFEQGQSILDAAQDAGVYIPHLCHDRHVKSQGNCKVCTVKVNGRNCSACTMPAQQGQEVLSNTQDLGVLRKTLIQMLFVEGNHLCPGCVKSGDCKLQAVAYFEGMRDLHFQPQSPKRPLDASHPEFLIDFDRCILCGLCVRASHELDAKDVFELIGRGLSTHLAVNSSSGLLVDSLLTSNDAAAKICPVGAIVPKNVAYEKPIGERTYDRATIEVESLSGKNES